jgi:hypothetical protein
MVCRSHRYNAADVAVVESVGLTFEGDDFSVLNEGSVLAAATKSSPNASRPAAEYVRPGRNGAGSLVSRGDETEEQACDFDPEVTSPSLSRDRWVAAEFGLCELHGC